jgi:hypothetical protein
MRLLLRTLVVVTLAAVPVTARAQLQAPNQNLATRDLVALHQAGLGDEVLIALIEANYAVFNLGYVEIVELRKQGLSERVLIKMIESKNAPPRPSAVPPLQQAAPTPVVVHQTVTQEVRVEAPRAQREREYVQVPVYVPVPVRPREPVKEPEPVYWGFNGQRRPDAWKETPKDTPPKKPSGG